MTAHALFQLQQKFQTHEVFVSGAIRSLSVFCLLLAKAAAVFDGVYAAKGCKLHPQFFPVVSSVHFVSCAESTHLLLSRTLCVILAFSGFKVRPTPHQIWYCKLDIRTCRPHNSWKQKHSPFFSDLYGCHVSNQFFVGNPHLCVCILFVFFSFLSSSFAFLAQEHVWCAI